MTKDEQERERYEARLKWIRDQQSFMEEAAEKVETALRTGHEQGRKEGREEGEYVGRIHFGEWLLNRELTPSDDLLQLSRDELKSRAEAI